MNAYKIYPILLVISTFANSCSYCKLLLVNKTVFIIDSYSFLLSAIDYALIKYLKLSIVFGFECMWCMFALWCIAVVDPLNTLGWRVWQCLSCIRMVDAFNQRICCPIAISDFDLVLSMCFFIEFVSCLFEDMSLDKFISAIAFTIKLSIVLLGSWPIFRPRTMALIIPMICASRMRFGAD